jgi:thioredoxin
MIQEITEQVEFEEVIASNRLILADFYTTWCEPCKLLDEILDRIESKLPAEMQIVKLDSEKLPGLATRYEIRSAPVLVVFKNEKIVWRMNGFKMDDELLEMINDVSRET